MRYDKLQIQTLLANAGIGAVGRVVYLAKSDGNSYAWFRDDIGVDTADIFFKVSEAENALTTYRNDVVLVTPDSHAWYGDTHSGGEALTWDKSCTHMLGLAPFTKGGGMRSRFGHSGYTMANFMTVSGNNNLFKNLYWMHGSATGGASDVRCLTVSGHRNVFDGCHFGGPNDQTQGSAAGYKGVTLSSTASHNYFKNCVFGGLNAVAKDAANCVLDLTTTGQMNVFEDCIFWTKAGATTTCFIDLACAAGLAGRVTAMFLNCQFINVYVGSDGSVTIADAIKIGTVTEAGEVYLYFDNRCSFGGVTDIAPAGKEECILFGHSAISYDTSAAAPDYKPLGLAHNPES